MRPASQEVVVLEEQLDHLIQYGQRIVDTTPTPSGAFHRWRRDVLSILKATGSENVQRFSQRCSFAQRAHVVNGLAILRAAKEDIETGVDGGGGQT